MNLCSVEIEYRVVCQCRTRLLVNSQVVLHALCGQFNVGQRQHD